MKKNPFLVLMFFVIATSAHASDFECYVGINNHDCYTRTVISKVQSSNVSQLDAINKAFDSLDPSLKKMCMTSEVLSDYYIKYKKSIRELFWYVSDDRAFKILAQKFPLSGSPNGALMNELREMDECKYQTFCAALCGNLSPDG